MKSNLILWIDALYARKDTRNEFVTGVSYNSFQREKIYNMYIYIFFVYHKNVVTIA